MLGLLTWFCFCGFIGGIIFGRHIGKYAGVFTVTHVSAAFLVALILLCSVISNSGSLLGYDLILFQWIQFGVFNVQWGFCLDNLSIVMSCVVTFISTLVHLYSLEYMGDDPHLPRFMSYLSLFTFFMLILVTGNNLVQMFVGWEGVGIASYLLINFWMTRLQANKAAFKAMLFNKIADMFLLLAFCFLLLAFNSFDYDVIFSVSNSYCNAVFQIGALNLEVIDVICFFLFLGAMGKSAQIGFHNWLPDAMEGPTPVSALIHAATMVTAGVFLVVRCSYLFELAPDALIFVSIIGAITALFGSTVGLFSHDLKRVIAFSTCSQLGYMMLACGLSQYEAALFHLATHAVFKALLFLTAGSIIHAMADEQDMRKMGGLLSKTPVSYTCFLVGSLNLMGIPFLSGFYSKDLILELIYSSGTTAGMFAYVLGGIAAIFTAAYSTRVAILVFLNTPNYNKTLHYSAGESGFIIKNVLILLAFISIVFGGLSAELFAGLSNHFFSTAIYVDINTYNGGDAEFISAGIRCMPLLYISTGVFFSYFYYQVFRFKFVAFKLSFVGRFVYQFLVKKWYTDRVVNQAIGLPFMRWARTYAYYGIDRGIIETFGPTGFRQVSRALAKAASNKFIFSEKGRSVDAF